MSGFKERIWVRIVFTESIVGLVVALVEPARPRAKLWSCLIHVASGRVEMQFTATARGKRKGRIRWIAQTRPV